MDPMQRINELAGGQSVAPTPPAEPTQVERVCATCGTKNVWRRDEMPPESCTMCHKPWNAPAMAPAPAPAKRGRPKKEKEKETGETQPTATEQHDSSTTREVVEARIRDLIAKYQLNELEPKPVGTGVVYALGFTRWVEKEGERLPQTFYMQPTDSPSSFRELYEKVRELDRSVAMDAALINGLTDELAQIAYRGEIDASLWNGRAGRVRAIVGAHVRIGARVSKRQRLLFTVLGVVG